MCLVYFVVENRRLDGGVGAGVLKTIAARERREHREGKFSLRSMCSLVADQLSRAFVGLLISNREPCEPRERENGNGFSRAILVRVFCVFRGFNSAQAQLTYFSPATPSLRHRAA